MRKERYALAFLLTLISFCAFGAMRYLDLTEIAVKAYDDVRLEEYVREAETVGVQEHGFPRLASNLGQLVAAGWMPEKKSLLDRLLTVSCACAKKGKMPPKSGGNEFSVRELVSAVMALERAGAFPPEKISAWKADLAAVDAHRCYTWSDVSLVGDSVGHNWPLFGAASEQARIHFGLGGDPAYVEVWVTDQLRHFDRNGMYRDPHEPAVYELVGRLCYMTILHFGYDGPCRAKIEEELLASAEPTLAMLSVCGEIPYGGRSNQFLHNNTLYAAVAEWYAAFFTKRGDAEMTARFKDAARRSVEALEPWLKDGAAFHVKNRFPKSAADSVRNVDQKWFGCEDYAYFDKYMITMGSWAMLAQEFASGDGKGRPLSLSRPSADLPGATFATSEHFHWKFTNSRNYTVQEDWNANPEYDATGIGRIHRRGAPPAICLSTPFAEKPHYVIGVEKNPSPLAIAAVGGKLDYEVSDWGVTLIARGGRLTLPAFEFDGAETTRIAFAENLVKVYYRGWTCRYAVRDGMFVDTGLRYFNRNGRYRRIDCMPRGAAPMQVYVTIEKEDCGWCICGEAPERANDFFWENDRVGFRAYGPGDVHKWSGIDVFNKCVSTNIVVHWLRHRSSPNFHLNQGQGMDDYAVGPGRGVGGVALRKDGKWLPDYGNWVRYRVLTNSDELCAFELDYKLPIGGEMTLSIALPRGSSFFSEVVSFSPEVPLDGVEVAVGIDTNAKRKHQGDLFVDRERSIVSLFEDPHLDKDGRPIKGEEGSMMSAIRAVAGDYEIVEGPCGETMLLGKRLPQRKSDGRSVVDVLVGADWTEAGRFRTAQEWHDYVRTGRMK